MDEYIRERNRLLGTQDSGASMQRPLTTSTNAAGAGQFQYSANFNRPPSSTRRPPTTSSSAVASTQQQKRPPSSESRPTRSRPITPARDVKKNERLADRYPVSRRSATPVSTATTTANPPPQQQRQTGGPNDPFAPQVDYGKCEYCLESGNGLGSAAGQRRHFSTSCQVLTRCPFCSIVVPVWELTSHSLARCTFAADQLAACPRCGLAIDALDAEADGVPRNGKLHPSCRNSRPPAGAAWCPLCAVGVPNAGNVESWRQHLTSADGCYNNPRKRAATTSSEGGGQQAQEDYYQPQYVSLNNVTTTYRQASKLQDPEPVLIPQMVIPETPPAPPPPPPPPQNAPRLVDADKLMQALMKTQISNSSPNVTTTTTTTAPP